MTPMDKPRDIAEATVPAGRSHTLLRAGRSVDFVGVWAVGFTGESRSV